MGNLEAIFKTIVSEVQEHFLKVLVGFVLMGLGWYFGQWRAHFNWKNREFLDRLNFSLNWIEGGTLRLRTLAEKPCEDVFLNLTATTAVLNAAKQTTESQAILPLPDEDYWYYLNSVLNELSMQFAEGHLRKEQGQPVSTATYLIAITCEHAKELRMRKIRAMIIQKSLLLQLPKVPPKFEKPHHSVRWATLVELSRLYSQHPGRFLEVELSV